MQVNGWYLWSPYSFLSRVQDHDAVAVVRQGSGAVGFDGVEGGNQGDVEKGSVAMWRARGLPPAQSKDQRWGAPYHQQFSILFIR